jgi:hypothetical protein
VTISTLAALIFVFLVAKPAVATQTYCAVVKLTPDGFLALRAGPGAEFPVLRRLRPFDFLWMDTGSCRANLCDESRNWLFVEGVPRLDGPLGSERKKLTQGWVRSKYINPIDCPTE